MEIKKGKRVNEIKIKWKLPKMETEDKAKLQSLLKRLNKWIEEAQQVNKQFEKKYCKTCPHNTEDGFECILIENCPCELKELDEVTDWLTGGLPT